MQAIIARFITLFSIVLCLYSGRAGAQVSVNNDTTIYPIVIIQELRYVSDYEFIVKRNKTAQVHLLSFQPWGTVTTILIYEKGIVMDKPLLNKTFSFSAEAGLIDISGLKPGRYLIEINSCHHGGQFNLLIE